MMISAKKKDKFGKEEPEAWWRRSCLSAQEHEDWLEASASFEVCPAPGQCKAWWLCFDCFRVQRGKRLIFAGGDMEA